MSASAQSVSPRINFFELVRGGAAAPILVLAMLAMVVVPLPAFLLDVLFSFNIALSLVVLLGVVYVRRPLEYSVFPTVLLLTTLLRLALNVASTRVVLLKGHNGPGAAGNVIEAFGHFVVGGSFAVGIVVFSILTIINFVVVTKGAGRISEVSARFILDALPGKQMAIDADLNAGLLTRDDAKIRRDEVREEADFYGSMDGASKFIRGDAIAGILILFINMVGGVLIGTIQHELSFADASRTYALLSIGDGLVAQIPSLLTSIAVAMLVTRVSRSQDMSNAVIGQVLGQQRALVVGSAVLVIIGIIPGMPNLPFLALGTALGVYAWRRDLNARKLSPAGEVVPVPGNPPPSELSWDDLAPIDALGLEVGYRLVPLVDRNQGGELMLRVKGVRRKLTETIGFLVPPVHIRDNLELAPSAYRILLHGVPIASSQIYPERELALNPGKLFSQIEGITAKDPAFGLDAIWILPGQRSQAESLGLTVVDPATVIATHISQVVRENAAELLGHEETRQLLEMLAKSAPKLVEELTPKLLPMSVIVRVLQNLLLERVPIRQLRRIAEALAEHAPQRQDPDALTAAVRTALGRFIIQEVNGVERELPVFRLGPELERVLQDSVSGNGAALEPGLAEQLHQNLERCTERQQATGGPTVLLVPGSVRTMISRLARHSIPGLSVLAYHEVPDDKRLKLLGLVG
jgi:flagellar biosynthesis protein FlhA